MINAFYLFNGKLLQKKIEDFENLINRNFIWIDIHDPTEEEVEWIKNKYDIYISPNYFSDKEVDESAKFFEDEANGSLHINSKFFVETKSFNREEEKEENSPKTESLKTELNNKQENEKQNASSNLAYANNSSNLENNPEFSTSGNNSSNLNQNLYVNKFVQVIFILHKDVLFSVRQHSLTIFDLFIIRSKNMPGLVENSKDILLGIYSKDVEHGFEILERIADALHEIGEQVLSVDVSDHNAAQSLAEIAKQENLNSIIRKNLMDTRKAISFLIRMRKLSPDQIDHSRQLLRDLDALDSNTAFLFDKINFLIEAIVGFVNINQNKIIKRFSIINVLFLPPSLIAAVFGMTFEGWFISSNWKYGYVTAFVFMLFSCLFMLLYFQIKGWFKN